MIERHRDQRGREKILLDYDKNDDPLVYHELADLFGH